MKKLILLLLAPALAYGALTNIVVKPNANPDSFGNWATKMNAAIDQVNTNTGLIGGNSLAKNPATANQNMGAYTITNVTDVLTVSSASVTNIAADVIELQANAISSNTWVTVTNFALSSEQVANKNQTNGYAGLNAQGKIDAEFVDIINIMFAGAEAIDVP